MQPSQRGRATCAREGHPISAASKPPGGRGEGQVIQRSADVAAATLRGLARIVFSQRFSPFSHHRQIHSHCPEQRARRHLEHLGDASRRRRGETGPGRRRREFAGAGEDAIQGAAGDARGRVVGGPAGDRRHESRHPRHAEGWGVKQGGGRAGYQWGKGGVWFR